MKKLLIFLVAAALSLSLFGCGGSGAQATKQEENTQVSQQGSQQAGISEEEAVKKVVEGFGSKLQMVSLQAEKDVLKKAMEENYAEYVTPQALEKWVNDPENAPGRAVSSPWPDRIEILSLTKTSETGYEVKGKVIEITSVEKTNGGAAAKRPITLTLTKSDGKWLIDAVTLGAYEAPASIAYENSQYGFQFFLPASWANYTIVEEKWEGLSIGDPQGDKVVETGPKLSIRHPEWTKDVPRQDIPIMVFTLDQWSSLEKEKFHIGAAPMGPSELGRNNKYVFALPARYNFAFPKGFEEVEDILKGNPLHTTDVK